MRNNIITQDRTISEAEIRIIAQNVVKEYTINVNENIKELAHSMQEQLTNFADRIETQIDNRLRDVVARFDYRIDNVVLERGKEIEAIRNDNKLREMEIRMQLDKLKDKALTKNDLLRVYIKVTASLSAIFAGALMTFLLSKGGIK